MVDSNDAPLTYNIATWYGFILSIIFLLYGGVKLILSFLDRNYTEVGQLIIFTIIGLLLITIAFAFKELKLWGWYGLIVVNGLIILVTLWKLFTGFSSQDFLLYENIVLLLFSGVAVYTLLASQTKRYLSGSA